MNTVGMNQINYKKAKEVLNTVIDIGKMGFEINVNRALEKEREDKITHILNKMFGVNIHFSLRKYPYVVIMGGQGRYRVGGNYNYRERVPLRPVYDFYDFISENKLSSENISGIINNYNEELL